MNEWDLFRETTELDMIAIKGVHYQCGDRVRLRPRPGGDIFDLALTERIALIEAIEQDLEDRIHFAVVLEDDPGKDLGLLRQPGHRFFFAADEIELLPKVKANHA